MRTVTAFFDSRSEAEDARTRLTESSIQADNVRIIDKNHSGASASDQDKGVWQSIKDAFMPEEDSYAYEEGLNRGGYLVCAQVDEVQADQAVGLLEQSNSIDFDQRQEEWRGAGWAGFTGSQSNTGFNAGSGTTANLGTPARTDVVSEERIPIVEESLRVGKREVERGGARVRSYVRDIPVHEQVSLREEHVSVERRPVDEKLTSADLSSGDLLRDRTIEMTETAEEAVVGKEARVTEELVVRKTAEEHVENIDDTVRKTDVEVHEGVAASETRPAFGFGNDRSTLDQQQETETRSSELHRDDEFRR